MMASMAAPANPLELRDERVRYLGKAGLVVGRLEPRRARAPSSAAVLGDLRGSQLRKLGWRVRQLPCEG